MPMAKTRDGAEIFYKDWGSGQPILFSHGWPLGDAWDAQMAFMGGQGFREIAHDRRSHGRSDQTWDGNDMDTYAHDPAALMNALDLRDAVLVGHSTGGGEVAHDVGRQGTARVAKVVLVGAVPPLMLKTEANPGGPPLEVFDGIRKGTYDNRAQFLRDLTLPFYGYNRAGAQVSEGVRDSFWLQGMMGGLKGQLDCIRKYSEIDYTDDLRRIDVPTLIVHGDDEDRADRRLGDDERQDRGQRHPQDLRGRRPRTADNPPGRLQRRSPRLHALSRTRVLRHSRMR